MDNEMTPAELRARADELDRRRRELEKAYMNYDEPAPYAEPTHAPWERVVEFEGESYTVDMRRVKSREFARILGDIQKQTEREGQAAISDMLAMFDYVFGGECDDHVVEVVKAQKGYDDLEEICRIEQGIFEAIDAKN